MDVLALIEEARRVFTDAGFECGDSLLPPAPESAIEVMGEALALPLPSEIREVYRVYGGQGYVEPGVTGLFGQHRLHSPDEVVEHHRMFLDNCLLDPPPTFPPAADDWGYWVPSLIPFASWDAYDLCIHSKTGEVWEFIPNTGLIRHRPSIAAVLREIIGEARAGREPRLVAMRLA